ncbi:alpha/beta hydrolase family esterase [Candidatus Bipolaricaulota bacterium]
MATWIPSGRTVMVVLFLVGLVWLVASCRRQAARAQGDYDLRKTLESGGLARTYWVHLPTDFHADPKGRPVVLFFHGAGGTGLGLKKSAGMDSAADKHGLIAVYPDAAGENWAEGIGSKPDRLGIDDLEFVRDLVESLESEFGVDPARIYVVGYSQGGFFAHRLAVDLPDRVAAYATVASSMSQIIADRYHTPDPIPVLMMHGTADSIFLRQGVDRGFFSYLSQDAVVQRVCENNACADEDPSSAVVDDLPAGMQIRERVYANDAGEILVKHCAVENGGHRWRWQELDTASAILEFFMELP